MELAEQFDRDGYIVVRDILSTETVAGLRELLSGYFVGDGAIEMPVDDFLAEPNLWSVVLTDRVLEPLRQLLPDDFVFYPNMTVRKSLYVGWHVDTAFDGPGKPWVWDPQFRHVQGAIYLQDNTPDFSGGIDVRVGSHRPALPWLRGDHPVNRLATGLTNRFLRRQVRVDSRAGDLVLWHARTAHRSSSVPPGPETGAGPKLGIFFSCARNDPFSVHKYLTHLLGQAVQLKNGSPVFVDRYRKVLDIRYPASFPNEFQERAEHHELGVATF